MRFHTQRTPLPARVNHPQIRRDRPQPLANAIQTQRERSQTNRATFQLMREIAQTIPACPQTMRETPQPELRNKPQRHPVAQASQPAVSQCFQPADRGTVCGVRPERTLCRLEAGDTAGWETCATTAATLDFGIRAQMNRERVQMMRENYQTLHVQPSACAGRPETRKTCPKSRIVCGYRKAMGGGLSVPTHVQCRARLRQPRAEHAHVLGALSFVKLTGRLSGMNRCR